MEILNLITKFWKWLISADSAGVLTLVTGIIAWVVYRQQVKLRDKEAATVLLAEIRNA